MALAPKTLSRYEYENHRPISVVAGEQWTAKQRQMHPIHYTVSYRASFKPELPDYFIRRYLGAAESSSEQCTILDPFGGRGTTALQANLLGHKAIHNDLNPISSFLARSRQEIPDLTDLKKRLDRLDLDRKVEISAEERQRLSPFFHPRTLQEIKLLRLELLEELASDHPSTEMLYIGVTALSRLHGHSSGFFSVYSFPQISILPERQLRNNLRRGETPEYRPIKERIWRKIGRDLSQPLPDHYHTAAAHNRYLSYDARDLSAIEESSVDLVVTSPPFLDKVDYLTDNWMRAWFLGCEESLSQVELTITSQKEEWIDFMSDLFGTLLHLLKPSARAVIEVGEVKAGNRIVALEELLLESLRRSALHFGTSREYRLEAEEIVINSQQFTKLANCWGATNNQKGTNSNRCLVLQKRPQLQRIATSAPSENGVQFELPIAMNR